MTEEPCKHCGSTDPSRSSTVDRYTLSVRGSKVPSGFEDHSCCLRCADEYEDCPDLNPPVSFPAPMISFLDTVRLLEGLCDDDAMFRRLVKAALTKGS